jgi:putative peptidoglycan lipid II flippase
MRIGFTLDKWRETVGRSPLRKLGHSALLAAVVSLAPKGFGFIKELLVAASFGVTTALDIYLVAFVLIGFPLSILLNAVQTALITSLAAEHSSSSESKRLYVATALLTLVCLIVLLPLWLMLLPNVLPWLASGFSPEKRKGLEEALFWLIPYYFLNGMNLLGYGVMQAKGRYLINGLLPSVTPIFIIIILLISGPSADWHTLVTALVIGTTGECVVLLIVLHRSKELVMPRSMDMLGLKSIVKTSLALLPGTIMLAMGPVVEQALAASMGEGTNAALGYGFKLPAALQGILLTAIAITTLPYFANQLGKNRAAYCLHSLVKLTRWLFLGGLLLVIPLSIFSSEIVALLYQRGAFNAAATSRVAPIQFAYFVQLPFALVAMLGMKVLAALGSNRLLSIYTIVAVLLQGVLAYVFGMHYGATGIAWSATLVSALLAITYFLTARSTLHRLST